MTAIRRGERLAPPPIGRGYRGDSRVWARSHVVQRGCRVNCLGIGGVLLRRAGMVLLKLRVRCNIHFLGDRWRGGCLGVSCDESVGLLDCGGEWRNGFRNILNVYSPCIREQVWRDSFELTSSATNTGARCFFGSELGPSLAFSKTSRLSNTIRECRYVVEKTTHTEISLRTPLMRSRISPISRARPVHMLKRSALRLFAAKALSRAP